MNIIKRWLHKHYFGIPHAREGDGVIVQTCYECGKERKLTVDLKPNSEVTSL